MSHFNAGVYLTNTVFSTNTVFCCLNNVMYVFTQDILNHVMEDLDNFISLLKSKTTAWNELEKKRKKSKRKKHDGKVIPYN